MGTIAQALVELVTGVLGGVGDLFFMQRLEALELSFSEKNWTVASQLEFAGASSGLITDRETNEAVRRATFISKVSEEKRGMAHCPIRLGIERAAAWRERRGRQRMNRGAKESASPHTSGPAALGGRPPPAASPAPKDGIRSGSLTPTLRGGGLRNDAGGGAGG